MLLLAGLGVDPWDVLHQGLSRRTGIPVGTWAIIAGAAVLLLWIPHSLRVVRTCIEATVLLAGWLLDGTIGVGTVVYAACIGPLAHIFVPLFSRPAEPEATSASAAWRRRRR